MNIHHFIHHDLTVTYTDHPLILPKSAIHKMLREIAAWERAFPKEDTFAEREWGVPSLLVRFDGALDASGEFQTYEIQDGPGWAGYAGVINPALKKIRDDMQKSAWPHMKVVMRKEDYGHDDDIWLEKVNVMGTIRDSHPLMVRKLPPSTKMTSEQRAAILRRSVKPFEMHSDKRYGIEMGWWKRVSDVASLPWHKSFALKPLDAMGSEDVMLWRPEKRPGRSTRTQIERTLQERGEMILQPFIEPMKLELGGKPYNAILRPFFGYHPAEKRWVPMGGVWTARPAPALRIHGAADAISGPLVLE